MSDLPEPHKKKSEEEGLLVNAAEIRSNPEKAKETIYTASYVDLQEQKRQVGDVLALLHKQVRTLLSEDNPRARISLAELINAYAMTHNVALALEKQLIETTHKEVDLRNKLDLGEDDYMDPFKMQKIYKEVMKKIKDDQSSGKLPEPINAEVLDQTPKE